MRYFFLSLFLLLSLLFSNASGYSQYVPKKAGICFHVADNQTVQKWNDYDSVFKKYNFNFGAALNLGLINPQDLAFIKCIDTLVAHGNEIMSHSPNHNTTFFTVNNFTDTLVFSLNPAVDHIKNNKIYLKVDSINPNTYNDEGSVILTGNKLISVNPGEFKKFSNGRVVTNIYLPYFNTVYSYGNLQNLNQFDPDTLTLVTFWNDALINTVTGIFQYKKLAGDNVFMNLNSIKLLFEHTENLRLQYGLPNPKVWVQPGGNMPLFNNYVLKPFCELFNYKGAFTSYNTSLKYFNEYDALNIKKYSFSGYDFDDETKSFQSFKTVIADNIARHKIMYSSGHFGYLYPLLGGWNGYLNRVDSLLFWCQQKNIPVKNVSEWISILYDSLPNPYENIFPQPNIDLDEDGYPDGYSKINIGNIGYSVNYPSAADYFISRTSYGYLCSISTLGGIEKGLNILKFYTKGNSNDSISIKITYNQSNLSKLFYIKTNTSNWKKQSIEFNCPDSITTIGVEFHVPVQNPNVKLSNISLRKKSILSLDNTTVMKSINSDLFKKINIKQKISDPFFDFDSLSLNIVNSSGFITEFDSQKNLIVHKPTPFWQGEEIIKIKVENPDQSVDTLKIKFKTLSKNYCKNDSIILTPDFTVTPDSVKIYSTPYNSSLNADTDGRIHAIIKENTIFFIKAFMANGLIIKDSINFGVYPSLNSQLAISTTNLLCSNDSLQLFKSNNYSADWYLNDTLFSGASAALFKYVSKPGYYNIIQTDSNACITKSPYLNILPIPGITLLHTPDTLVCANTDTVILRFQIINSDSLSVTTSGSGFIKINSNNTISYVPTPNDKFSGKTTIYFNVGGINNCNNIRDSIRIFYKQLPAKPAKPIGNILLCENTPASIYSIAPSNSSVYYNWYILPENAATVSGDSSVSNIYWNAGFKGVSKIFATAANNCGVGTSSDTLEILVISAPLTPNKPVGDTLLCESSPDTYYFSDLVADATNYSWYVLPDSAGIITGNSNSASIHWNNNFTGEAKIFVKSLNMCGISSASDTLKIQIMSKPIASLMATAGIILCGNDSVNILCNNNYFNIWLFNDSIILNSDTLSGIYVHSPGKYNVVEYNQYGCENISNSIFINQTTSASLQIIHDTLVCANTDTLKINYQLSNSDSLICYTSGNGLLKKSDHSISYLPGPYDIFTGKTTIKFIAYDTNQCGVLMDSLTINYKPLPNKPSMPSGNTILCENTINSVYTTNPNLPPSVYQWSIIPYTAANLFGNTMNVTVGWQHGFNGQAKILVSEKNNCGLGLPSDTLTVQLIALPQKPSIPTGDTIMCQNSPNSFYASISNQNPSTFIWSLNPPTAGSLSPYSNNLMVDWNDLYSGKTLLTVKTVNNCGISQSSDTLVINIKPKPENPVFLSGIQNIPINNLPISEFIAFSKFADTLLWRLQPDNFGAINSHDSVCQLAWNQGITGSCQLYVQGYNDCGFSLNPSVYNISTYYSSPVEIQGIKEAVSVIISPNPTLNGIVEIKIKNTDSMNKNNMKLFNSIGNLIFEKQLVAKSENELIFNINLSGYAKGMYFLKIGERIIKIIYK